MESCPTVSRLEVIDHSGASEHARALVRHGVRVQVDLQDDDRPMKVFLTSDDDPATPAVAEAVALFESGAQFDPVPGACTPLGEIALAARDADDEEVLAKIRAGRSVGLTWNQIGVGLGIRW